VAPQSALSGFWSGHDHGVQRKQVHGVVFDLGETLVNEARAWAGWADWLGVSTLTLFAALGATIAQREPHDRAFELVRPGIDVAGEAAAKEAAGHPWRFDSTDLYPDALPCLDQLIARGQRIGVVGNQPEAVAVMLPELQSRADMVATSTAWGVHKPDQEFFDRVSQEMDLPPSALAYVGDRLDNDVLPAMRAGMTGVFIRRGPWGVVHATWPESTQATISIESLEELGPVLDQHARSP
jgi:FMN phosphatase YigB (HAD superfamily)